MYLNTIDYGDQNQGIEAAARNYFGLKPSKEIVDGVPREIPANLSLTLPQIALLVGLPNAPSYYLPTQYSDKTYSCNEQCDDSLWDNPCVGDPRAGPCIPSATYDWGTSGHEWLDWRRARTVLQSMVAVKDITQTEASAALQQVHDILLRHEVQHWASVEKASPADATKKAPHFVDYVLEELYTDFGIDPASLATRDWSIYTTLDLNLDEYAAKQLDYYIDERHTVQWPAYAKNDCGPGCDLPLAQTQNAHNGAVMAIDPRTGDILAMVGSVHYGSADPDVLGYNNMTTAVRKMGSTVKSIVYATAFQMGWNPAIVLQDEPICWPTASSDPDAVDAAAPACKGYYVSHNDDPTSFSGSAPLRFDLANSLNPGATEALSFIGATARTSAPFVDMARRLGITSVTRERMGPATALGDQEIPLIEMTSASATFANGGTRAPYRSILQIQDASGHVLYPSPSLSDPRNPSSTAQVLSPQADYMLTSILTDNKARAAEFGSDNPLAFPDHPGVEIAAKTGTAAGVGGPSDTVTVGYSPYLAVGVWVGNTPGNDDMGPGIIGISGSGYIFHDVMEWADRTLSVASSESLSRAATPGAGHVQLRDRTRPIQISNQLCVRAEWLCPRFDHALQRLSERRQSIHEHRLVYPGAGA